MKEQFINLIQARGFRLVKKKPSYTIAKHPDISILYLRLYKDRFTVAMYADTEEFQYKEELYKNFDMQTKKFLIDLLKDNKEIKDRIEEENVRIKEENKNKKVLKFEQ